MHYTSWKCWCNASSFVDCDLILLRLWRFHCSLIGSPTLKVISPAQLLKDMLDSLVKKWSVLILLFFRVRSLSKFATWHASIIVCGCNRSPQSRWLKIFTAGGGKMGKYGHDLVVSSKKAHSWRQPKVRAEDQRGRLFDLLVSSLPHFTGYSIFSCIFTSWVEIAWLQECFQDRLRNRPLHNGLQEDHTYKLIPGCGL